MKPMRTLIVDDEPLARENLRLRLRQRPDVHIVGEARNGTEAVAAVADLEPELLFLDIQMPDLDGFEVLDRLVAVPPPVIVFVTAYDRYALEAFRVHALDYLLKPFEDERFAETVDLAGQSVAAWRRAAGAENDEPVYQLGPGGPEGGGSDRPERLVIKNRGRVFFLKTADLDWVEANGDYSRLHAGSRAYLVRKTMTEMEARLDPRGFARVSRSAIVNLDSIAELRAVARGEYRILLDGGTAVKLTRTFRSRLEQVVGDRL